MRRLVESRLLAIVLAAVLQLALVPWPQAAGGDGCGCCDGGTCEARACCCEGGGEAPDDDDDGDEPCGCVAAPPAVPAAVGEREGGAGAVLALPRGDAVWSPAPRPGPGRVQEVEPRARSGPPLWLVLEILLI